MLHPKKDLFLLVLPHSLVGTYALHLLCRTNFFHQCITNTFLASNTSFLTRSFSWLTTSWPGCFAPTFFIMLPLYLWSSSWFVTEKNSEYLATLHLLMSLHYLHTSFIEPQPEPLYFHSFLNLLSFIEMQKHILHISLLQKEFCIKREKKAPQQSKTNKQTKSKQTKKNPKSLNWETMYSFNVCLILLNKNWMENYWGKDLISLFIYLFKRSIYIHKTNFRVEEIIHTNRRSDCFPIWSLSDYLPSHFITQSVLSMWSS